MNKELGEWIFTFARNQKHGGSCQPIFSTDAGAARDAMFQMYGEQWGFQYTREEWEAHRRDPDRMWEMEVEMKPVVYILIKEDEICVD